MNFVHQSEAQYATGTVREADSDNDDAGIDERFEDGSDYGDEF